MENLRCFEIKYFGATNTQGSRIKINDMRFKKSKMINRSYKHMNGKNDAIDYLKKIGIKVLYGAEFGMNKDILLTDNFEMQLNGKVF